MYEIALYLGLAGFLLLIFSFLSGMRIIKFKPKLRLHKKIGLVAFFLVMVHGLTMLYYFFFS